MEKFKNMVEENISQELRLKNIEETRNYFLEEIKHIEFINEKYKKVFTTLNYIKHLCICGSIITGYISLSTFASLIGIPSYRIYEFCIRIKNLSNNYSN